MSLIRFACSAMLVQCLALASLDAAGAPAKPVPAFVVRLAEDAIARDPAAMKAPDHATAVGWFAEGFLFGFLNPDMSLPGFAGPGHEGSVAGQRARRAQPAQHDQVLRDYGYVQRDLTGRCTIGFEASRFTPALDRDASPIEKIDANWWVAEWPPIPGPPAARGPSPRRALDWPCRIVGWVSPPGGYGHVNMFSHQVLVIRFEDLAQAAAAR